MATAPAPPAPAKLDLSQLTAVYVKIRDARSALKEDYEAKDEKLVAQLEMIEGAMLRHMNANNIDSVRTDGGTFYRQEDIKPSIADDEKFFGWVKENDAFDAMYRRVSERFVKEYMESHKDEEGNDGPPPPGVTVHRSWVVRVRRPQ